MLQDAQCHKGQATVQQHHLLALSNMALINNMKANKGVIGGWGGGSEVFIYLNDLNGHTEFHTLQ